jgi:hypothetical protein
MRFEQSCEYDLAHLLVTSARDAIDNLLVMLHRHGSTVRHRNRFAGMFS